MAISRMNMERQLRAGGGIMTLEEPRQGYFLGKIVRKAKKAVKKVVKSPIGKAAIIGALGFGIPGTQIGGLFGRASFGGAAKGLLGNYGIGSTLSTRLPSLFAKGNVQRDPGLFRGLMDKFAGLSTGQKLLLGGGAAATLAPFFMGGDEEEIDPGIDVTGVQPMVADIRNQAKEFYKNPASRAASGLFFMPQQKFVQPSFFAADGGLADIPREGYKFGELVEKLSMLTPSGIGMAAGKKLAESIKDDEDMKMAGMGNVMKLFENYDGSFDRAAFEDMLIQYEDSGAKANGVKLMDFAVDFLGISSMKEGGRVPMQEGGIMDLGGMEKDYREGGFVPIGAEERADDVPARLSKNEFVFTADAVRNAGGGDIDKGAEVMQNMMDNLEAGGTISEESQGMENPAQAMFDQAQQLESRII